MSFINPTRIDLREKGMKKVLLSSVAFSINEFCPPQEQMWFGFLLLWFQTCLEFIFRSVLQMPQFAKFQEEWWLTEKKISRVKLSVFFVFYISKIRPAGLGNC